MAISRRGSKPGSTAGRRRGRESAPIVRRGTVRLQHDVARRVRAGHPWVYREALSRALRDSPGSTLELVDWDGDFVGKGLFDGDSAIAVRVVTRQPDVELEPELFAARVRAAIAHRRRLLDFDRYQACRLVNAESDGVPAVVLERYGDYIVAQLFTPAVMQFRDAIYDAVTAELAPKAIYEQRRFKSLAGEAPRQAAAELVRGNPAPVELEVREGELRFWVDVTAPLSTGLFIDLREGRRAIAEWSRGRRVLNLFSYTGAISVCAQQGGASEVVAVDVAAKAHARARKNFALNGFEPEVPEHIAGDAFKVLAKFAERKRQFDLVVLDPPAFASASGGGKPWSAGNDYAELVTASLDVMAPGGLLVAVSNTRKMSQQDFDFALAEGGKSRNLRIIDRRWLPVDFPTLPGFPEASYLKFAVALCD